MSDASLLSGHSQSGTRSITLLLGKLVEFIETTFTGFLVVFTHGADE